jgi:hypothetical protein
MTTRTHWYGNEAEYTGRKEVRHGVDVYEIKLLEGPQTGEMKWTTNSPKEAAAQLREFGKPYRKRRGDEH